MCMSHTCTDRLFILKFKQPYVCKTSTDWLTGLQVSLALVLFPYYIYPNISFEAGI